MDCIEHIYIHVPFCKKKCLYCDFYSIPVNVNEDDLFEEYAESLISELNYNSLYLKNKSVKTVYIGGGSPALLGFDNLERLFGSLNPYLDKGCECTIEMNPEHFVSKDLIKDLNKIGINRVSIGVQSSIDRLLENIGRAYSKEQLIKNISVVEKLGMILSLDFMFALPGETKKDLASELKFIKSTNAHHLSYYMFTPAQKNEWTNLPDDETISDMFKILHGGLEKTGYEHYEISNYAKAGFECRHNSAYWTRKSYLGIGAGAHGYFKEKKMRYWNIKDIRHYMDYENKMENFEILDKDAERSEEIMLGMRMLKKGVALNLVNKSKLGMLEERRLIVLDKESNNIKLGKDGMVLLNSVVESLI